MGTDTTAAARAIKPQNPLADALLTLYSGNYLSVYKSVYLESTSVIGN